MAINNTSELKKSNQILYTPTIENKEPFDQRLWTPNIKDDKKANLKLYTPNIKNEKEINASFISPDPKLNKFKSNIEIPDIEGEVITPVYLYPEIANEELKWINEIPYPKLVRIDTDNIIPNIELKELELEYFIPNLPLKSGKHNIFNVDPNDPFPDKYDIYNVNPDDPFPDDYNIYNVDPDDPFPDKYNLYDVDPDDLYPDDYDIYEVDPEDDGKFKTDEELKEIYPEDIKRLGKGRRLSLSSVLRARPPRQPMGKYAYMGWFTKSGVWKNAIMMPDPSYKEKVYKNQGLTKEDLDERVEDFKDDIGEFFSADNWKNIAIQAGKELGMGIFNSFRGDIYSNFGSRKEEYPFPLEIKAPTPLSFLYIASKGSVHFNPRKYLNYPKYASINPTEGDESHLKTPWIYPIPFIINAKKGPFSPGSTYPGVYENYDLWEVRETVQEDLPSWKEFNQLREIKILKNLIDPRYLIGYILPFNLSYGPPYEAHWANRKIPFAVKVTPEDRNKYTIKDSGFLSFDEQDANIEERKILTNLINYDSFKGFMFPSNDHDGEAFKKYWLSRKLPFINFNTFPPTTKEKAFIEEERILNSLISRGTDSTGKFALRYKYRTRGSTNFPSINPSPPHIYSYYNNGISNDKEGNAWIKNGPKKFNRIKHPGNLLSVIGPDFMKHKYDACLVFRSKNDGIIRPISFDEEKWMTPFQKFIFNHKGFAVRIGTINIPKVSKEEYNLKWLETQVSRVRSNTSYENKAVFSFRLDQNLFWLDLIDKLAGHNNSLDQLQYDNAISSDKKSIVYENIFFNNANYDWKSVIKYLSTSFSLGSKNNRELCLVVKMAHLSNFIHTGTQTRRLPYFIFEDIKILGTSGSVSYEREGKSTQDMNVNFIFKHLSEVYTPNEGSGDYEMTSNTKNKGENYSNWALGMFRGPDSDEVWGGGKDLKPISRPIPTYESEIKDL